MTQGQGRKDACWGRLGYSMFGQARNPFKPSVLHTGSGFMGCWDFGHDHDVRPLSRSRDHDVQPLSRSHLVWRRKCVGTQRFEGEGWQGGWTDLMIQI